MVFFFFFPLIQQLVKSQLTSLYCMSSINYLGTLSLLIPNKQYFNHQPTCASLHSPNLSSSNGSFQQDNAKHHKAKSCFLKRVSWKWRAHETITCSEFRRTLWDVTEVEIKDAQVQNLHDAVTSCGIRNIKNRCFFGNAETVDILYQIKCMFRDSDPECRHF